MGLLLAFLQLFRHVRDQMNTLTEQHLHHYYFDLLEQQQRGPTPDRAIVCFQLAEHVDKCFLEKQTRLLASVNDQGVESHYATETGLLLTQAKLVEVKTLFMGRNEAAGVVSSYRLVTGIYAAPVANSRDGLGLPLSGEDPTWPVFGEEQIGKNPGERRMADAPLGFAVSAPILVLHEGQRAVDFRFQFTESALSWLINLLDDVRYHGDLPTDVWVRRIFYGAFKVLASGVEGWFPIQHWQLDPSDQWAQNRGITMTLFLTEEDPAIVAAPPEVLGEDFGTPWPVVKILLDPEHAIYAYSFVADLELEALGIEVRVKGGRSMRVYNELGLLDISAPFLPFGPMPKRNTAFIVGHPEFLGKKLTDLSFHLEWAHLPETEGGFAEHYRGYAQPPDNSQFKVRVSALSNYKFWPLSPEHQQELPLFGTSPPKGRLRAATTLEQIALGQLQIQTDYAARVLPEFSNKARSGYFKFQLAQPAMAFGHAEYPRLFAQALIAQSKPAGLLGRSEGQEVALPEEPYVPLLNQITFSYRANTVLNMRPLEASNNDVAAQEKVFCLYPFGRQLIFSEGRTVDRYLFPRYEADGYLFLGFSGVEGSAPLNLLFHLKESHSKNWGGALTVRWEYLLRDRWEPLTQELLMSDGTQGFTTTGIVRLVAPSDIDTDNTTMPAGVFWLRISAKGNLETAGRALGVWMDAMEVVWVDNGDETHFDPAQTLPRLKELATPRSEIAAITQPIDFYGGKARETLPEFYVRVSERLRHKNRGITPWDIEHLILGRFPFVREAKCITPNAHPDVAPGTLLAVAVPYAPETVREPSLGFHQMEDIRDFLKKQTGSFAAVRVISPDYEKVKITCSIRLKEGLEQEAGLYAKRLHEELLYFICPWLYKGRVAFGAGLSRNEVLAFIKNRPYIQFVTRLSLVKIFEPTARQRALQDTAQRAEPLEILRPENPWSVFVPVAQHSITFLSDEKNLPPEATAIEAMRLGTDFVVSGDPADDSTGAVPKGLAVHPTQEGLDTDDLWFLVKT